MKKVLALILTMLFVLSLVACGGSNKEEEKSSSKKTNYETSEVETEDKYSLTDSKIKSLVEDALVDKIRKTYDTADPYKTRYSIGTTERDGNKYTVYGTLTMYDKYGQVTTGWIDGSGSYTRSFEVKISYGEVSSCDID